MAEFLIIYLHFYVLFHTIYIRRVNESSYILAYGYTAFLVVERRPLIVGCIKLWIRDLASPLSLPESPNCDISFLLFSSRFSLAIFVYLFPSLLLSFFPSFLLYLLCLPSTDATSDGDHDEARRISKNHRTPRHPTNHRALLHQWIDY